MTHRKLTDEDVERVRELWAEGWSAADLAAEFDVSPQHVGRIVRHEQRTDLAGLDTEALRDGVAAAVEAFVTGTDLPAGTDVFVAIARTLAAKLDACGASESAAAAQAAPRVASELVDVLARLQGTLPGEDDQLERLRRRHQARRLSLSAAHAGGAQ